MMKQGELAFKYEMDHQGVGMTGWAKMSSLIPLTAGFPLRYNTNGQEILMSTITTPDTCKAMMQDTGIKISINDLYYIGAKKPISFVKTVIVNLLKLFKMILNALVV